MDFTLDEDLAALRGLADDVFTDHATPERVRAVERTDTRVDDVLWDALAGAGLLGIAVPEEFGGAGLGTGGLCVVLEQQGRQVAPVPLWASAVAAAALAEFGSAEQRRAWLPPVADGSARLTVALEEFGPAEPTAPRCAARPDGAPADGDGTASGTGWSLTGTKAAVPTPDGAAAVLVSADTGEGPGLFLVEAGARGTGWERAETTDRQRCGHLHLDGTPARPVGAGTGARAVHQTVRRARVALAALQLGVARGALRYAVSHVSERHQFGRPLATFQAVAHQLADCHIDIEAMHVTLWNAATSLDAGEPAEASERAALVAQWWATEAGQRVVHRVQHVHGGIGVDIDYPVHRYYLWGKQIAGTLGGPSATLDHLGAELATTEVTAS